MIKLIGFDLDDTLWDLLPVIIRAEDVLEIWLRDNVSELNFSVREMRRFRKPMLLETPNLIHQITEFRRRLIEKALIQSDINPVQADVISREAIEVFLVARNQIDLFEGVESTLLNLSKDFQVCALSNGNADINRLGLKHLFDFSFSAEEVGGAKPSHHLFTTALSKTSLQAHEMIYVGDDPLLDVDAAKDLGVHAIWMDRGKKKPGRHQADQVITKIAQLEEAIKEIASRV
ncbi:MAG: HAD-IA family hydrolase [Pseudomonadales bacterium]|nr:HAD-IA family hydrolase [Pseudomonadales bacterium]